MPHVVRSNNRMWRPQHNDEGNPAAARNLRLQNPPDPPLGFTAWLWAFSNGSILHYVRNIVDRLECLPDRFRVWSVLDFLQVKVRAFANHSDAGFFHAGVCNQYGTNRFVFKPSDYFNPKNFADKEIQEEYVWQVTVGEFVS